MKLRNYLACLVIAISTLPADDEHKVTDRGKRGKVGKIVS